jgi:hypothetical protein
VRGRIYTIRAIDMGDWKTPAWGLHLEGIWMWYPGVGGGEWAINPKRFRLVVDRPTDIEVFRKMLAVGPQLKR